jgi:hypothetical protein
MPVELARTAMSESWRNPKRTFVLRYEHKRALSTKRYVDAGDGTMIMVLSPADPEAFVRDVQEALAARGADGALS